MFKQPARMTRPSSLITRHFKLSSQSGGQGLRALVLLFVLLAACSPAATPTPTPAPTLVASLTATATSNIEQAVSGTLTAMPPVGPTATDITLTATLAPETTETLPVVTLPALAGQKIDPPLDITLPDGWKIVLTDVQVLQDVPIEADTNVNLNIRGFPIQVYQGPVTGGKGTIVLYWGFPNINMLGSDAIVASAQGTPLAPDLWSDGLRLLHLAVVEQGCTVGTDLKRSYRVGLLAATGTQFSAVNCPELPDTRGWFAGVQEKGLNFVFYVYVEGETVMNNQNLDAFRAASDELQAILDTVRFRVPDVTATPGS
jgi:hypothetical protein